MHRITVSIASLTILLTAASAGASPLFVNGGATPDSRRIAGCAGESPNIVM